MANIYETAGMEISPYMEQLAVSEEEGKAKEAGATWQKGMKDLFKKKASKIQEQAEKIAKESKEGKSRNRFGNLMTALNFVPGWGNIASGVGSALGEGYFAKKESKALKKGLEGLGMGGFKGTFLEDQMRKQNLAIEEAAGAIDPSEAAKAGLMAGGLQAGLSAGIGAGIPAMVITPVLTKAL